MAALDIDGTLVDQYSNLSKRTKQTITKLQNKGILVTLCTGRNFLNTLPIARNLNIKVPLICIDGIFIYDIKNKKILKEHPLKKEEVRTIIDIARNKDAYLEIVTANNYFKYIKDIRMREFDFVKDFGLYKRFLGYTHGIRYIKGFPEHFYNKINSHVVIIGAKPLILNEIKLEIESLEYEHLVSEDTLWKNYIFVHNRKTSKGYGLKFLCHHLNISLEEVVGIGDDYNDIAMFKEVGMSVAMGNAVDEVKLHAKDITKTIKEDGAAIALEKYFNIT